MALARVAAQFDNGHDSLDLAASSLRPAVRLPLRMVWIDDRLLVARAGPGLADLAGCEVRRVGRFRASQIADRLAALQGGLRAHARWNMGWVLHNQAMLKALGVAPSAARISLEVECPDGRVRRREIAAMPAAEVPPIPFPAGWWSPKKLGTEAGLGWRAIGGLPPLYLQQPERLFRTAELPALGALYVQFRQ